MQALKSKSGRLDATGAGGLEENGALCHSLLARSEPSIWPLKLDSTEMWKESF